MSHTIDQWAQEALAQLRRDVQEPIPLETPTKILTREDGVFLMDASGIRRINK